MPAIQALPTWLAVNNANFTSPTGITDLATGQQISAGGLNLGDYVDLTNDEAANASFTTNGLLFAGRYRLVLVDSGATAANVKTGTVGYLRAGSYVSSVVISAAGSGQTNGTYAIAANFGGGGTGAIITVVISGGAITSAVVTNAGYGYTSAPTFTVAEGGTPGTVVAQLNTTPNFVTSADKAPVTVRPVVFLNSITPGNYGFVQELGTATLLASTTVTAGQFVSTTAAGNGSITTSGTSVTISTVGQAVEAGVSGDTFKAVLSGPVVQD
jgi:hypothetical protein